MRSVAGERGTARTCIREQGYDRTLAAMTTLARLDHRRNIARDAIHGSICLRIGDVSELVPILVDEERVVRVCLRLPCIVLGDGNVVASNELRRHTKLGADVGREARMIKWHLRIQEAA